MTESAAPSRELMAAYDKLEPWGYGEAAESWITTYAVGLGVPVLAIVILLVQFLRFRRQLRRAEAVEGQAAASVLASGPVVLRGKVAEVDRGDTAVRITIEQVGRERREKNARRTEWTESQRTIEVSPFVLALDDGHQVRVEPDAKAQLVDDLGPWRRLAPFEGSGHHNRVAVASLDRGETLYASGELATMQIPTGGYRGGEAWVLRAGPRERLLLSTHGFAAAARRNVVLYGGRMVLVLVLALIVQLLAVPYHVALLFGSPQVATVEKLWTVNHPETSKRSASATFFVSYRTADGVLVQDELADADYAMLAVGKQVPVHVSPLETTIGPHPTMTGVLAFFPVMGLVVACVVLVALRRPRGWYEQATSETVRGGL